MADVRLTPAGVATPSAPWPPKDGGPGRLLHIAALAAASGVTALLLFAAWHALGPDSQALPAFDSDSAIPVLMSNETHWDVFHAFYFGEDRYGAWPFWLAHGLAALLHRPVTAEFLHAWGVLFVFSGALPAALLFKPWPGLAVLAYAISVLVPESRGSLFDGQPYTWQLPLLFWGWWCLRRSWAAQRPEAQAGWLSLAALVCGLASWTSALSGPLLLTLTVLEGLNAEAAPSSHPRRRWLLQLLPALFAMAGEAVLRLVWHRYVWEHFQRNFRIQLRLDWGHFAANSQRVLAALASPAILGALLVLTAAVGRLLVQHRRAPVGRWRFRSAECTLLGAFGVALLPLPVLALVRHVRENAFAARYFAPTYVFLVFGGLLALASFWPGRTTGRAGAAWYGASTLALAGLALLLFPRPLRNPNYARLGQTAQRLAEAAPGALLLDGYWGTYVFAALAPPGGLLPLPHSGALNRIPWLEKELPAARRVLVGHRELLSGAPGTEPRWLFQYGTLLELSEPSFLSDGVDRFSTYRPRAVEAVPFFAEPPLPGLELAAAGEELLLHAQAASSGTALAVELSCLRLARAPSGWGEGTKGERVPLRVEAVPGAVFFFPQEETTVLKTLHLSFAKEACEVRGARWYQRPS